MKAKKIINFLFLLFLIGGTIWILRNRETPTYRKSEGAIFGTTFHITYEHSRALDAEIRETLLEVDTSLSMFNAESILARVNRNDTVTTDAYFDAVFNLSQKVARETGGAFDPTVAPLVNAWGFGFKHRAAVTPELIDSLLTFVGYEKVSLQGSRVQKADERVMLDFGAIAKGFGVDAVANRLKAEGVENYMVEIGGEIAVKGLSAGRKPWRIGVTKPHDGPAAAQEVQTILQLTDKALATSGNYRNYYYENGQKFAHTIHPATGYPVRHSLLSATVVAPTCAQADAYATAFMVMGLEEAQRFLATRPHLMACLVSAAPGGGFSVWHSPALQKHIAQQ